MIKTISLLLILNISFFLFTIIFSNKWIFNIASIPNSKFLLVLGAGITMYAQPTKILEDRLISASAYAQTFSPKQITLSGTYKNNTYNEPASMLGSLLNKGLLRSCILLDPFGFSTLDSCLNFLKDHGAIEVVIVSQKFHLFRAILVSRILGLQSYGLIADNFHYKKTKMIYWYLREFFAIPFNILKIIFHYLKNRK